MTLASATALGLTLALAPAAFAQPAAPEAPAVAPSLLNEREPLPGVRTGGLPDDPAAFRRLADEGVRLYVDLRSANDPIGEAPAAAAAAGLVYVQIPIAGEADLDLGAVRALDALLDDPARGPAVVACASGNRSGALLALRAFWLDRLPAEAALELGQRAGLTRLEPTVRTLLGLPPAEPEAKPN